MCLWLKVQKFEQVTAVSYTKTRITEAFGFAVLWGVLLLCLQLNTEPN